MNGDYFRARSLSRFERRKIDWLLKPLIPFGFITTVAGEGEEGKSTLLCDLFARVTNGHLMPRFGNEPEHAVKRGSVIILSKEDDPGLMLKPRIEAAGGDTKRVKIIGIPRSQAANDFEVISRLDTTIGQVEEIIGELGDVRAMLIDPITDFAGQLDLYREDQVRRLLSPLAELAARYNIAIVNVLHLTKDPRKKARNRIMGSVGLVNTSRSVLVVGRGQQSGRRFLMMEKANLWHERKAVAFDIRNVDGQPKVFWDADWEDVNIEDILSGRTAHITKQQQAGFKIRAMLDEGPAPAVTIIEKLENEGFGRNTIKAAKREIGAKSVRRDDVWWWELDQESKGPRDPLPRERL